MSTVGGGEKGSGNGGGGNEGGGDSVPRAPGQEPPPVRLPLAQSRTPAAAA